MLEIRHIIRHFLHNRKNVYGNNVFSWMIKTNLHLGNLVDTFADIIKYTRVGACVGRRVWPQHDLLATFFVFDSPFNDLIRD